MFISHFPFSIFNSSSWWGEEHLVRVASPNAQSTQITSLYYGHGAAPYMSLTVNVAGEEMSTVFYSEHVSESENFGLSLSVPDTLFVNNDNDLGGDDVDYGHLDPSDDDVPCGYIQFSSPVPTNGTISIENLGGFVGDVFTVDAESVLNPNSRVLSAGSTWTVQNKTAFSVPLYFDAYTKSAGFETSQIKVRWTPEIGPAVTAVRCFTVVEPVAEPICSEWTTVGGVRKVVNPCGIVIGSDSVFRVGVEPSGYPDDMIAWQCVGAGSVEFPDGNTGREVRVRGVSAGHVELRVHIGDCSASAPSFSAMVVAPRTVRLSAWIVSDENNVPARTEASVRSLVAEANEIYSQVGVTFDIGDRIIVTNIPAAYNVLWEGSTNTMWNFDQLVDLATDTGGLELYFVNSILTKPAGKGQNVRTTIGGHSNSGIVISASGTATTLAHEIGHAFGMKDVYRVDADKCRFEGRTKFDFQPFDWNGGCQADGIGGERYYELGTGHYEIIGRMLMDGYKFKSSSDGVDITYGLTRGFNVGNATNDVQTGYFHNYWHVDSPVHD